jgi:GNAT superfamily N-acetyltransferase
MNFETFYLESETTQIDIHGNSKDGYVLSRIMVPKALQGKGEGSKAMEELISRVDQEQAIIATTPSSDFGSSKPRLIQFYKGFGFVPNKGKNKDFRFQETMIRYPR